MEEDFEPIVSEATGAMAGITDDVMPKPEKAKKCIIKVVGVGGGGGNAVKHMYNEGINDVEFIICNTDKQALDGNPVPNKILIGEGLGAGAKPEVAREAALQSEDKIKAVKFCHSRFDVVGKFYVELLQFHLVSLFSRQSEPLRHR